MSSRFNLKRFINEGLKSKNMKLKTLVDSIESLNVLTNTKIPATVSYKISLFIKKSQDELDLYNSKRKELLEEYGTEVLSEDGKKTGNYKFETEDSAKNFNEEINKLLDQDITIESPEVKISELSKIDIEPKYLLALDWLIKE